MKFAALIEPPNDLVEEIYHWAKGNAAALVVAFCKNEEKKNEAEKHVNKTSFIKTFKIEDKPFNVKIVIDLESISPSVQKLHGVWNFKNKQLIIVVSPNRQESFQSLLGTIYGTIRHELIHVMQDYVYEFNFGRPGNIPSKIDVSDISKVFKDPKEELEKHVKYVNIPEEFYANLSNEIYKLKSLLAIFQEKYWFNIFKIFVGAAKPKKIRFNKKDYIVNNSSYFLSLSVNSPKWRKAVKLFYSNLQDSGFSF